jgi:2-methylisocitrate lyase-like PEP mutase family enzyme
MLATYVSCIAPKGIKMTTQLQKCEALSQLHNGDTPFVIANPWDIGSARMLEALGFKALATTSAGFAVTLGKFDGQITLEEKLRHSSDLANATSVPISVDFENGFADSPDAVAANIKALAETGVAGCSIEDFSRDSQSLYDFNLAVERMQAAVSAVEALDVPFQLCARAENLIRGVTDMDDTIARLQAFEKAGAHMLYAPGLSSLDQIRRVKAETTKPLNVLAPFFAANSIEELAEAGAIRISLGNALSNATLKPLLDASEEMLTQGTFSWVANMASGGAITKLLKPKAP